MSAPTLRTPLAPEDLALLKAVRENDGFALGNVCFLANLPFDRKGLANGYQRMLHMERHSLVRRLDDRKPLVWLRTPEGSEELRQRESEPSALPCHAGEASSLTTLRQATAATKPACPHT